MQYYDEFYSTDLKQLGHLSPDSLAPSTLSNIIYLALITLGDACLPDVALIDKIERALRVESFTIEQASTLTTV